MTCGSCARPGRNRNSGRVLVRAPRLAGAITHIKGGPASWWEKVGWSRFPLLRRAYCYCWFY